MMKTNNFFKVSLFLGILFTIGACNKDADIHNGQQDRLSVLQEMMSERGANPDEVSILENSENAGEALNKPSGKGNYLYTESNDAGKNRILIYRIKGNGSLQVEGTTASGGSGTGTPLGSQGALVLDKKHEWLYAVNAGSNSVSSFKVNENGSLSLAHTANTHGTTPVSVTVYNNLLYVLNRGSDNIHGYRIGSGGSFTPIAGSTRPLSGVAVDAPQILFTPDGERLVVPEKATNIVGMFKIKINGSTSNGIFSPSVGQTPFGFDFSRDKFMIMSNAAGGNEGAGSVTSYMIGPNGKPKDVNGAVPNFQAAPCWIAITKHGRFAYATNTSSHSISSYYITAQGALYLAKSVAVKTGMSPIDIVVGTNNSYVYALSRTSNTIGVYRRMPFGGLESAGNASSLPAGATGLATY